VELTLMQACSLDDQGEKKKPELIPIAQPKGHPDNPNYLFADAKIRKSAAPIAVKQAVAAIPPPAAQKKLAQEKELPVTSDLGKLNTVSIAGFRKKPVDTNQSANNDSGENTISGPVNPFTLEQFDEAWNALANMLKAQGKDSLWMTMTKNKPSVGTDYVIKLPIDNKTQQGALERVKQEFLEFLRKKLDNYAITVETFIEEGGAEAFLYTNKDKFKKMAEKNPNLLLLQKRLNLDIEF
jgi:DNA polymerase-3 subunit gamma/tau